MRKATEKSATALTPTQKQLIDKAVKQGQSVLKEGGSKADAARAMFESIHDLPRDNVIEAFIVGATVTTKGAPTYYYNVSRKFKRSQEKPAEQ